MLWCRLEEQNSSASKKQLTTGFANSIRQPVLPHPHPLPPPPLPLLSHCSVALSQIRRRNHACLLLKRASISASASPTGPVRLVLFNEPLWAARSFSSRRNKSPTCAHVRAARHYILARRHMLLSGDAEAAARFLVDMQRSVGRPDERDLFLAQAVLELLALGRRLAAAHLFAHFVRAHPDLCSSSTSSTRAPAGRSAQQPRPPFASPLLDFLYLLLLAVDRHVLFHVMHIDWSGVKSALTLTRATAEVYASAPMCTST